MYTAFFIGGEFDLTKRAVRNKEIEVLFHYRRSSPRESAHYNQESEVIDELVYTLQAVTRDGVLIYEYELTRGLK